MIKSKINIIYYFIGIKDNKKKNYVIDKKYIFIFLNCYIIIFYIFNLKFKLIQKICKKI